MWQIWPLYLYGLISLLPVAWWRWWITQYPAGIPASDWLFNGNGIRLRPAWWRWLFGERISSLILGQWGVLLAAIGGIVALPTTKKTSPSVLDWVTWAWAAGMIFYLVTFATGNVQHDYYQAMLVPSLALLIGRGIAWLWQPPTGVYQWLARVTVGVVVALSLFLSWYQVRGYYQINNPAIVTAGRAVQQQTDLSAKVIAPYGGDTAFLFQTRRSGWPIGGLIEQRLTQGATHYVTTSYDDEARQLESTYRTLEKTDDYLLLDLTQDKTTTDNQTNNQKESAL
jgi:hypothetical protein